MLTEPKFTTREPQPYAAIRLGVAQVEIGAKAPPLVPAIIEWIERHGKQAGDAFFNYTKMDGGQMEMEVGAPTATVLTGDDRVVTGTLPGGRYVEVTYTGHYDGLRAAHESLHQWLGRQGMTPQGLGGDTPATLLEIYETDPDEVSNPDDWITHIAFKLPD